MMVVLYSGSYCPYSHRCRFVLNEKQMESNVDVRDVDLNNKPEELVLYNPNNMVPVLVDREVKLYESNIINEYVDDRFPHPQLVPGDIMHRAKMRLMMHVINTEIFSHVNVLEKKTAKREQKEKARQSIGEELMRLMHVMERDSQYLIGNEFTLLDAAIAPLLWRLEHYNITLPPRAAPIQKYAQRLFNKESFIQSLTTIEKAMRK